VDPYICAKARHDPLRSLGSMHARLCARKSVSFSIFGGFLQLATAKGPERILTQNTPKDADSHMDVPFLGREHKI